jgi:putative adhesin
MTSRRFFLLSASLVPALTLAVGCVNVSGSDTGWFTQRDEKRFSVDGKPEVVLSTFDGSIEIRSWDRPDVLVVVEKHAANQSAAGTIEVLSAQQGNRVSVEVKSRGSHMFGWWMGGGSARLIVSVPQSADIRAASGDGHIDLDRVNGTIVLRSGDGRIHAGNSSGDVSVATGDGSIELDHVDGTIEATTGDGRVKAVGKLTGVRARSGDGSITIQADPGSAIGTDWDITSGDGSITLQIPDGFNAELDARTGDGGIHLDGVNVTGSASITKNSASGQLGSGGRALRVRTGDGSITLRRF